MKLFAFLGRGHTPDIEALSALVDGALDAPAARELEAHVAGCAACTAELEGLRAVKSMLAALPQVEPSRAFRVRLADVEAAPAASRTYAGTSGLLRAMPALAAVGAFVFVAAIATDFSTRDGDGDRQATTSRSLDNEAASGPALDSADGGGAAGAERTSEYFALTPTARAEQPAAGVVAPDASENAPAPSGADEAAADGQPEDATATDTAQMLELDDADEAPLPPADAEGEGQLTQFRSEDDGDDGNRIGFVIVEIAAGVMALGAAAIFFVSRRKAA
jgi:hypothetical protein